MWNQLTIPWRICIEEAWQAYCAGSLPVGAVITDTGNKVIARGRNRIFETAANEICLFGNRAAHAEINALLALPYNFDPVGYILYTTTEPFPMCVGAIRMCRIGEVRYASRDVVAGGVALFTAIPFMEHGKVVVKGPEEATLETILLAMQMTFLLSQGKTRWGELVEVNAPDCVKGIRIGRKLFYLRSWKSYGILTYRQELY